MISDMVELRRRLIWLWRASACALRTERPDGNLGVLWIFDTRTAPDGYPLQPFAEGIAHDHGLSLWSFGPRKTSWTSAVRFMSWLMLALRPDFWRRFEALYGSFLDHALATSGATAVLSGSYNGVFGSLARPRLARAQMWEVQHGFLDESYFPIHAGRFFARSELAMTMVRARHDDVLLERAPQDLNPPAGEIQPLDRSLVREVHCFSKNPGGGCTAAELKEMEAFAASIADRLECPFHLHLHPRDSKAKLVARHRSLRMLTKLPRRNAHDHAAPRLLISSFSTALATRSRPGDLLLNVQASAAQNDLVRLEQYGWLPTILTTHDIAAQPTSVFRRSK